jgi:hypothetical protein
MKIHIRRSIDTENVGSDSFVAWMEHGGRTLISSGPNEREAIGNLIATHADILEIEIVLRPPMTIKWAFDEQEIKKAVL